MHFIQNSWFVVYSIWFVLLILGVVGIISYIQNRQKFLRRIAVYFSITFLSAMVFSGISQKSLFVSGSQFNPTEINNNENQLESPSLMSNVFRFVGSLLQDRITK